MNKAIILLLIISLFISSGNIASATTQEIKNNMFWVDIQGNDIKAQGGSIYKSGDLYHWFAPQFSSGKDYSFYAINHYVSTDLKTWRKLSAAIKPGMKGIPFKANDWVGRPYVLYNAPTKKYVMLIEWGGHEEGVRNKYAFLTSSSLNGKWQYIESSLIKKLPDSKGDLYSLGDVGAFQDSDGNAYIMYTFDKPENNYSQAIVKLDPASFTRPLTPSEGGIMAEFTGGTWPDGVREAAAIFHRDSTYYYFTSTCNGWNSSKTMYRTASAMSGPWSDATDVPCNTFTTDSFNTQHDFVLTVTGSEETSYIYCGDRWTNYTGVGIGRNAWFPITFDVKGIPTINGFESWAIDVATGKMVLPVDPNILKNPGFEGDYAEWTKAGNVDIATAEAEIHTGGKAIKCWSSEPYTLWMENSSASNLAAGTYKAGVFARGGGTWKEQKLQIFINGTKVNEVDIPGNTNWTQYTIDNINIPAGAEVKVCLWVNSEGNTWAQYDDFSLIKK